MSKSGFRHNFKVWPRINSFDPDFFRRSDYVLKFHILWSGLVRGWEIESHVSVRASEPTERGREIICNLLTVYNTIIHCFGVKFIFFGIDSG